MSTNANSHKQKASAVRAKANTSRRSTTASLLSNTQKNLKSAGFAQSIDRQMNIANAISAGFSVADINKTLSAVELDFKDLTSFGVVAARTLTHSRSRGVFTPEISDRINRFLRIWNMADNTFCSKSKARVWLSKPNRRLENKAPVEWLNTEEGARIIEQHLHKIDHGLAA